VLLLSSLLAGCKASIEVLQPDVVDAAMPDAGKGPIDAPDLPDGPLPSSDATCGGCAAGQLCSAGSCVERRGLTMVEAGRVHTCLIADGRLFCWGANEHGELGLGDVDGRQGISRVGAANDWLAVSGGEEHSCGLRAPGRLFCWGDNSKGQLGVGDTERRPSPTPVGAGDDWEAIFCGGDNCCALRDAGRLYCWGDNLEGKPGQDDGYSEPDVLEPREVVGDRRYRVVALGQGHVNAITEAGELLGWGRTPQGETGTGVVLGHLRAPMAVAVAADSRWVSVAAAQHHSCAVDEDGGLYCWGMSDFGELGGGVVDDVSVVATPARVGSDSDWAAVAAGWFHSCATKRDGRLHCWGRAIEGQLGQGGGDPVPQPNLVMPELGWKPPVLGGFHSCALTGDGALYCWGQNNQGQLGLSGVDRVHEPTEVVIP